MQYVNLQFDKEENYRVKEAFRTLRSNVEFSGENVRVIAITSCTPNEGKTSCAMELARAFAEAGKNTILVDGDMRKSVLVGRYKAGNLQMGLTHYLVAREELNDVICSTNMNNLFLIFAGPVPPNPSELLGSLRFSHMIEELKKDYEYVIIDTPPLGSVIDAAVVAKQCDGTILIIENNAVSYRFVQRVKEQLDVAGAKLLGAVLNKVNMTGRGYYGHYGRYYGRYYGYYYGSYGEYGNPPRAFTDRNAEYSGRTDLEEPSGAGQQDIGESAEKQAQMRYGNESDGNSAVRMKGTGEKLRARRKREHPKGKLGETIVDLDKTEIFKLLPDRDKSNAT